MKKIDSINNTNETLNYYNKNAKSYALNVKDIDLSDLQIEFMSYLPKNGKILDLGSGSGRDSKVFLNAGYKITAVDGSFELAKIASEFIGQDVIYSTFQEYKPTETFDGDLGL